jgi:hypothetical protein
MAEPAQKSNSDIEPDIAPNLRVIQGGGESTPGRANLRSINDQEANPNNTDNNSSIAKQEEDPDRPEYGGSGSYYNNFTGNEKSKLRSINGLHFLRRKGPMGIIITLLLGGGLGFSALFSPGLLIVQMKEVMVNKFNAQLASMDVRTTKILSAKIDNTTSGICSQGLSVGCKYSSMSDKMVSNFEKAGITVNSEKTTLLGRSKPTSFDFNGENIKPSEFSSKLSSSTEFRAAVKQAYNPKFAGFEDSIWKKAAAKLGISKKGTTISGANDDERLKSIQEDTKNPSTSSKVSAVSTSETNPETGKNYTSGEVAAVNAANEIADGASAVEKTGIKAGTAALEGVESAGNALKITGFADGTCTAYGAVQAVGYAAKTVRALQLARYAMLFLNVADMIKAGTAKPEDVSYLGKILTTTVAAVGTTAAIKPATDSFGYKFAAYGETGKMTNTATQFLAGGGLTGNLISITAAINTYLNGKPKQVCGFLKNPFVSGASLIGGIALFFIPGVDIAVGFKDVAQGVGIAALTVASAALPAMLKDIIGGVLVDKTTVGEASGDAFTSGSSGMMSTAAATGGNAPLTPTQAVAYNNLSTNIAAQYAQEDRLAASPFDITNSNTFMGNIVAQLIPYTSKMSSLTGVFSSVASVATRSLASITSQTTMATDDIANYEMCQDFDYNDLNGDGSNVKIATDPFCNVTYGIPPEALSADPIAVTNTLLNQIDSNGKSTIDPVTGDPTPGGAYEQFVTDCIDRKNPLGDTTNSEPNGTECLFGAKVNGIANDNYYLHYIDQRVEKGMDGYDTTTPAVTTSATQNVGTPDNVTSKGSGWTLTDKLDYSAITCASGTTDAGLYTHPIRGFTIRKCGVAGGIVASIVSQKVVDMFTAAKSAGVNFTLSSGFRSYEEQAKLFSQNCHQASGSCSPPTAAPGNSQHEAGIALDLMYNGTTICFSGHLSGANCHGNAGYDWLKTNASSYGFFNLQSEAWHWSASGS